jgi:anti-anti-sigma factor
LKESSISPQRRPWSSSWTGWSGGGRDWVLVDLRGLAFIDLAGIRVLLAAHERARRRGGEFAIVGGAPIVERLMRLLGLLDRGDVQ